MTATTETMETMETPEITDDELLRGFNAGTLAPELFHHREHVRVAWLQLQRHPPLMALERFCAGIERLAAAHGKSDLYHATITWAYLLLIHERRWRRDPPAAGGDDDGAIDGGDGGESWEQFAASNPDLLSWQPSILAAYYRDETLRSDLARQVFLMPDRIGTSPPG